MIYRRKMLNVKLNSRYLIKCLKNDDEALYNLCESKKVKRNLIRENVLMN